LPVEAIAQLPPGTAVLLDGARPPQWLRLTPRYLTGPFRDRQRQLGSHGIER
jgi:hypothetical protein